MTYDSRSKTFKTLDEQIEILKMKGLVINDYDRAKEILFRENYFFISGYRHLFMANKKDNQFIEGTTFEELYAMFNFDRKIRNIFFSFILVVENNLKSIISYQLSKKYGYRDKEYLNPKNFTQDVMKSRQVRDILNKMRRQIRVNGRQHTATLHYIDNYGYVPMWILAIADIYGLDVDTLSTYLSLVANYRNICAHEEVLYEHRTQRVIPDSKYHRDLDIEVDHEDEYIYGKNDLYAIVIILKQLLTKDEFRDFINQIGYEVDVLDGKVDTVSLNSILNQIGFPDNWRNIVDL